jgi:L-seryl-tRNA(Ser) seleniumtransferase
MKSSAGSAREAKEQVNAAQETSSANERTSLRQLPSVDELLRRTALAELAAKVGRELVLNEARAVLKDLRLRFSQSAHTGAASGAAGSTPIGAHANGAGRLAPEIPDAAETEAAIIKNVRSALAPSLRRVINATGVVLHTNLGRAPLSAAALKRIAETAGRYSNLEYDLAAGTRGRRDIHVSRRLAQVNGAEAAIVVNNNAAAVLLVLAALAKGGEVIVSRGELIEIGDGFRIPEIMAESGALLREVGTTNRTRIGDYERAIGERTRLLLRVHPSNFRIVGFTERPSLESLAALGKRNSLPVFEDLGSGCIADLGESGLHEPLVCQSIEAGADIVAFSGDKLLGGPQSGIIAGRRELVERIRRHPLFRALRVDKLVIAAMEETLAAYLRGAFQEVPVQRMLRAASEELRVRAEAFVQRMMPHLPVGVSVKVGEGFSVIGGGATPEQTLPAHLIRIGSARDSAARLEEKLRRPAEGVPVIARVEDDHIVLDLRTIFPDEEGILACTLIGALR